MKQVKKENKKLMTFLSSISLLLGLIAILYFRLTVRSLNILATTFPPIGISLAGLIYGVVTLCLKKGKKFLSIAGIALCGILLVYLQSFFGVMFYALIQNAIHA